jgi:hypothetical protein
MRQRNLLIERAISLATFFLVAVSHMAFGQPVIQQAAASSELPCPSFLLGPPATYNIGQVSGKELSITLENHRALLIMPEKASSTGLLEWVWFSPMVPNEPNEHHAYMIQHVLDAGMAFATIDVGESYGNAEGTRLYAAFHDLLGRCFHLSPKAVLMPQSRGGLMLFNWAAAHPDEVTRIAGIYTVCNVRSYPGLTTAAQAYGVTAEELNSQLSQQNPLDHNPLDLLAPLAKANVPVFLIHGADDKVVPLQDNSAEFVSRYQKLGGSATLLVVPGRGHEEVDEFFKSPKFVAFLTAGK